MRQREFAKDWLLCDARMDSEKAAELSVTKCYRTEGIETGLMAFLIAPVVSMLATTASRDNKTPVWLLVLYILIADSW